MAKDIEIEQPKSQPPSRGTVAGEGQRPSGAIRDRGVRRTADLRGSPCHGRLS